MTDTTCGVCIRLPEFETVPDRGREDTLIENLIFDNIIMDKIYDKPIMIYIGQTEETRCEAIRNIYFSRIIERGLEYPLLLGKKDKKISNVYFNDCKFECLSDEEKPNYKRHGAAAGGRRGDLPIFENVENIVLNNTVFTK